MEQVNQFKHAWMGHAYTYTKEYRTIYAGQLVSLLKKLPPPLGVGSEGSYYDCQILAKKVIIRCTHCGIASICSSSFSSSSISRSVSSRPVPSRPCPISVFFRAKQETTVPFPVPSPSRALQQLTLVLIIGGGVIPRHL